jgi:uncharacterized protein YigA (DUF484 family)
MAGLTPLDEKLAEVLGLAQAAQKLTTDVAKMEGTDQFEQQLEQMGQEAAGEDEALDGFEFLTMAEAGELGHWEIVQTMAKTTGEQRVIELADWAVDIQRKHVEQVRAASLELAKDEAMV